MAIEEERLLAKQRERYMTVCFGEKYAGIIFFTFRWAILCCCGSVLSSHRVSCLQGGGEAHHCGKVV